MNAIRNGQHVKVRSLMGRVLAVGVVEHSDEEGVVVNQNGQMLPFDRMVRVELVEAKSAPAPTDNAVPEEPPAQEPEQQAPVELGAPDIDKLPQNLQQKLKDTEELTADELNSVLSDIGATAIQSLKLAGVAETKVYGLVDMIQKVVAETIKAALSPGE